MHSVMTDSTHKANNFSTDHDCRYIPAEVEIVERIEESPTIFTLRLRFTDPEQQALYRFQPGQFNMLYLYGVGEIPISIVSDMEDASLLDHTIRRVGRVTRAMSNLKVGDRLGIRGPFGQGWPLEKTNGKNVLIITGGLGCAPAESIINHLVQRRDSFKQLTILQGVKHSDDLIWRKQYERWAAMENTEVRLAADIADSHWQWHEGLVTELLDQVTLSPKNSVVMICGPEPMMRASAETLVQREFPANCIWLSMERNMQCATGHCGHCQFGSRFVCKNGPVFNYPEIRPFLGKRGL